MSALAEALVAAQAELPWAAVLGIAAEEDTDALAAEEVPF